MTYDGDLDAFLLKTSADGDLQWSNTFGGPDDDEGLSVTQAPDGGYVMAGIIDVPDRYADLYLVKTNGNGKEQWSWTYGTSGPDWGKAVIAADGGYLLAGFIYASNNNGYSGCDGYLAKFSPDGNQLWSRQYIEPGMYSEKFEALRATVDGNYILAGTVGKLGDKICLIKVDRDGNQLWIKSYETSGDYPNVCDVRQTADGGYVIAGGGNPQTTQYLLRTDSNGNMLWYKQYDTFGRQFGGTVEQLPDGGFITGGACLIRTDKDGNLIWAELTDTSFDSWGTTVVANGDGSYTVAGGARSSVTRIAPILLRTLVGERATAIDTPTILPTAASSVGPSTIVPTRPENQTAPDLSWITTAGIAVGIFVLIAGILIIVLIIVLIIDERINRPRK